VENVLGEVGRGHLIAFNILNSGRLKIGALAMGGAKHVLGLSLKYAKQRKAFGTTIATFGAVQHKLAEMAIRIYATESMLWRTAGLIQDASAGGMLKALEEYAAECSILKVYGSEVYDFVADEGVQIHGGYGYHQDYDVERAYRDSRINRIYEGTNEINRLIIPGMLLKRAARGRLSLTRHAGSSSRPKDGETELVNRAKRIGLMTLDLVQQAFPEEDKRPQEVLMRIADIVMHVFAMESGLLRSRKLPRSRSENAACMSAVLSGDSMSQVELAAREVLAACLQGEALRARMQELRRLAECEPVNAVQLRRAIAARALAQERYIV
jgi:hypothetical protein